MCNYAEIPENITCVIQIRTVFRTKNHIRDLIVKPICPFSKRSDLQCKIRAVCDDKPVGNAESVTPDLEDVCLYFMPPENAPICLFPTYPKLTSSSNSEMYFDVFSGL